MRGDLEVSYISAILFDCKYLCKIYCAFKNMSKNFMDVNKEKDIKVANDGICIQKILLVRYIYKAI